VLVMVGGLAHYGLGSAGHELLRACFHPDADGGTAVIRGSCTCDGSLYDFGTLAEIPQDSYGGRQLEVRQLAAVHSSAFAVHAAIPTVLQTYERMRKP